MKVSKYIIFTLFISITTIVSIIFNGVYVLEEAISRNSVQIESQVTDIDVSLLDKIARKHSLILYGTLSETTTLRDEQITYYVYDDQTEKLQNYLGYRDGEIKQIIQFTLHVRFASLTEMEENLMLANTVQNWYLIGSDENFTNFFKEIRTFEDYDVTCHKSETNIVIPITYGIMIFSLLLILFYCHIENAREKKQIAISVIHGASSRLYYVRKNLEETFIFSTIYFLIQLIKNIYTQTAYPFIYVHVFFGGFILVLWIMNLELTVFNAKEVIYGYQHSKRIIICMNVMASVASALICAVLLSVISMTPSISKNIKAEPFFRQNSDRLFIQYVYKNPGAHEALINSDDMEAIDLLYKEKTKFFNELDVFFEPICVADCSRDISIGLMNEYGDTPLEAIYCNFRAKNYIENYIPDVKNVNLDDYDCILLIPQHFLKSQHDDAVAYLIQQFIETEGYKPERIRTLLYDVKGEILCFNYYQQFQFLYFSEPSICIASNTLEKASVDLSKLNYVKRQNGYLYKERSQAELDAYFENYTFKPIVYNAYEKFRIDYRLEEALFICAIILILLMSFFYISFQRTILLLDYQIHAIELSVKKILGYSLVEKNQASFKITLINTIINFVIACIFLFILKSVSLLIATLVLICVFILNIIIIYTLIRKIEKAQLTKILKGGAL